MGLWLSPGVSAGVPCCPYGLRLRWWLTCVSPCNDGAVCTRPVPAGATCPEGFVKVAIKTRGWASDVGWAIMSPFDGTLIYSVPYATYANYQTDATCVELTPGLYRFEAKDQYNDGWADGSFTVSKNDMPLLGPVVVTGSGYSSLFTVPGMTMRRVVLSQSHAFQAPTHHRRRPAQPHSPTPTCSYPHSTPTYPQPPIESSRKHTNTRAHTHRHARTDTHASDFYPF